MLTKLHLQTVAKSIGDLRLPNGVDLAELAFNLLTEPQQMLWVEMIDDVISEIEDAFEIYPSHIANAKYLLDKFDFDSPQVLFPWDVRELNKIYRKHLSKVSQETISKASYDFLRNKINTKVGVVRDVNLVDQLRFILFQVLSQEPLSAQDYEIFFLTKRKIASLDVFELNHAIDSIQLRLGESLDKEKLLFSYFKNIKKLILFYLAKLDYLEISVDNSYWAVSQIKNLSAIKMYFIDVDSRKKTFFSNGFRQDKLDSLLSLLFPSFGLVDIQKLSIDEKVDYLYTGIASKLNITNDNDHPPETLITTNVNSKYIALIILNEICDLLSVLDVEWSDGFKALLQQLLFKYTYSSNNRAKNINKYFDPMAKPLLNHKYIDGCLECVELL